MPVRLTILGSGTSHGIPMIGCDCAVCTSPDPHDRRTRTSAVFSYDDRNLLIDTSPELRLQCIANNIRQADAILYTHLHADHVVGLDDVRRFNWLQKGPITVYGSEHTLTRLKQMFVYAFVNDPAYPSARPDLNMQSLSGPVELFGRTITPIPYQHGPLTVHGFRVGNIAYCPDCNFIPDASRDLLRNLDVLVLNALRHRPHPTHFTLAEAIEEAKRIGAKQTYFIHIAHELKHAETESTLPPNMKLAHDGLVCESQS